MPHRSGRSPDAAPEAGVTSEQLAEIRARIADEHAPAEEVARRMAAAPAGSLPMFDREMSWLRFNERVLEEARDPATPLLERVRFLTIWARNLDEFFMIRVSGLKHQVDAGVDVLSPSGRTPREQLAELHAALRAALHEAAEVERHVGDALAEAGIRLVHYRDLDAATRSRWDTLYQTKVHPTLTPLAISPAFPFPFISNLSLNLAVEVTAPDGDKRLARIKIPDHLPRLVVVDEGPDPSAPPVRLLPIEELIAANLHSLFPGMEIGEPILFRVTRDADLEIREDEANDLLHYIEEEVRKRRFGQAVRLEVRDDAAPEMVEALCAGLHLGAEDVFRTPGMVDPSGLARALDFNLPGGKFAPFSARHDTTLEPDGLFARIAASDVLLHHPFNPFTPVADFVRQAARDPDVLAIKMTLYRTSGDSPVVHALMAAVENGKQVAAVVELKARFDEENNITWAKRLEEAGVHVIYGVPGLKIHAKLCLVVRREGGMLRRYAHIGTGNYNPLTARLYTDLGLFTCDGALTADVADLFNRITGFALPAGYRKALVAPRFMRDGLIARIEAEAAHARAGRPSHIILKCNAVIEPRVIAALYAASQAGVQIDLLVRGICGLVPGLKGWSETIRVRSVVGRFLEHSRVYWFSNAGDPIVYIGSADLMGRNLNRRIELCAPIESPPLKAWLRDVLLQRYLDDVARTRELGPDGRYTRIRDAHGAPGGPDVHRVFMADPASASRAAAPPVFPPAGD